MLHVSRLSEIVISVKKCGHYQIYRVDSKFLYSESVMKKIISIMGFFIRCHILICAKNFAQIKIFAIFVFLNDKLFYITYILENTFINTDNLLFNFESII